MSNDQSTSKGRQCDDRENWSNLNSFLALMTLLFIPDHIFLIQCEVQWADSPGSLFGHATGLRLVGEYLFLIVLLDLVLGVGNRILWWCRSHSGFGRTTLGRCSREVTRGLWDVCSWWCQHAFACGFWVWILCRGQSHWIHGWGLPMGSIPEVALVMGNFMGRRFWVGCGWFLLVIQGGQEETCSWFRTSWMVPPGTVGMVSYTHCVYVTCYFCYIF
jgi:hypothetical protein